MSSITSFFSSFLPTVYNDAEAAEEKPEEKQEQVKEEEADSAEAEAEEGGAEEEEEEEPEDVCATLYLSKCDANPQPSCTRKSVKNVKTRQSALRWPSTLSTARKRCPLERATRARTVLRSCESLFLLLSVLY